MMLYIENLKILECGYIGSCPLQVEEYASKYGFYFAQSDSGDCYLSNTEDCNVFEEVYI